MSHDVRLAIVLAQSCQPPHQQSHLQMEQPHADGSADVVADETVLALWWILAEVHPLWVRLGGDPDLRRLATALVATDLIENRIESFQRACGCVRSEMDSLGRFVSDRMVDFRRRTHCQW